VCPMKLSTSGGVLMVSFSMIPFLSPLCCMVVLRLLVVGVVLVGDHPLGLGVGVQLGVPGPGSKTSSPGTVSTVSVEKFSVSGPAR
jgi:hypothetical protein